ncbi:MAG TPA: chromate efflux transporter [Terracidiphilus sp.]|jgi:chromate transporter
MSQKKHPGNASEVFAAFLKLGLTSFGGPVAHIGYFREEFVKRRKWFDERTYADVVALCQFLPGPASSQVGMAIGLSRAGYLGALAAWTAFTLPSALAMMLFAYGLIRYGNILGQGWLQGLKAAAVAVVAVAVLGMARSLTPDRERATIAVTAAVVALAIPAAWGQIGAILFGGIAGLIFLRASTTNGHVSLPLSVTRPQAIVALVLFFVLLIGLPILAVGTSNHTIRLLDAFYRAGSLVFGGGHVVLPLLQAAVVPPGWVDNDTFLAGYGAAQAVPGPLFTFAAYLGTVMQPSPNGVVGAILCLTAIFLSSFLLIVGALPFWEALRRRDLAQSALRGVNAAVVGVLLAALYNPVWTAGILTAKDFALAIIAFLFLFMWQAAPWLVVVCCAIGGTLLAAF